MKLKIQKFTRRNIIIVLISSAFILTSSCKQAANEAAVMDDTKQATIDSMNVEIAKKEAAMAKQKTIDSMQAIADRQKAQRPVIINNTTPAQVAATPAEKKKKGWSGAAKGAVIGAGAGAIGGAIINKKDRGTGAVIGGLAGAGLGAGTGAILDSEKKKKEEEKNQQQ